MPVHNPSDKNAVTNSLSADATVGWAVPFFVRRQASPLKHVTPKLEGVGSPQWTRTILRGPESGAEQSRQLLQRGPRR